MPGFNIPLAPCHDQNAFRADEVYLGPSHTREYARKHRYLLEILEPLSQINLFLSKCTRPSPEIDVITVHNAQDEIKRPGKNRWKPVEFTFYEVLGAGQREVSLDDTKRNDVGLDNTASFIYNWWANTMIFLSRSRHRSVVSYLKLAQLSMLDGVGNSVWMYDIIDCWPSNVTPSDLDYSASELAEITVTLQMSKCRESSRTGEG